MSQVKQWPRKLECTLCAEPHMVDARGFKQHQNRVRSEQGAALVPTVVKNDPIDIYAKAFAAGWRAAMEETGALTRAAA